MTFRSAACYLWDDTMPKLRMTFGALRRMVGGMVGLLEAEGDADDPRSPEARARRAEKLKVHRAKMAKNDEEWELGIAAGKTPAEMKAQGLQPPVAKEKPLPTPGTRHIGDPRSGTGRPRSTSTKTPPSYEPVLPPHEGKSPGWLSVYEPAAYRALKQAGSPAGRIYTIGQYIMFKPKDPTAKAMFWAGVPEKKSIKGGAVSTPEGGEAKPHAWRTYEELSMDQRRGIGWIDPRDRGDVSSPPEAEEKGLDVRIRDGGARADIDVMGSIPGAEPLTPGKGGSTPSAEAMAAMKRGMAAKSAKLPDWESLSIQDLNGWLEVATKKYKSSRDPTDMRVVQAVKKEIDARAEGKPQKKATQPRRPKGKSQPQHTQPADDRFGKRKKWGQTSKDVEVEKLPVRPKKDED